MPGSRDNEGALPPDPMTQFAAAAVQLHEAFLAYVKAGFSEPQALSLTSAIITAMIHNASQQGGATGA